MIPVYMPFTYLSASTARTLAALVGPVVIYQPLKKNIPESLSALASQGFVEIRAPMTQDDNRLRAALVEFTDWARMNPGKSTQGAGFFSARQGGIPFFDETTINRIRSDIRTFQSSDSGSDASEAAFSARLFLAVAQENDLAADHLDDDLKRFKALEKEFLESMHDADGAGFRREAYGGTLWREDPGAKLTEQRIRAWSFLAAADDPLPDLMITTSSAVMEALLETHAEAINLERLAEVRLADPPAAGEPVLSRVLADLAAGETLTTADLAPLTELAVDVVVEPAVTITLYGAANRAPATVVSLLAPATDTPLVENGREKTVGHTLFLLVEIDSQTDGAPKPALTPI